MDRSVRKIDAVPAEFRTRSIPTAAHLICLGFEPMRIHQRGSGGSLVVFDGGAVQDALTRFMQAKQHVDAMLDDADGRR